jgi:hypothetical protein
MFPKYEQHLRNVSPVTLAVYARNTRKSSSEAIPAAEAASATQVTSVG